MPKKREEYNYINLKNIFGAKIAAEFRSAYGKGDKMRVWITPKQRDRIINATSDHARLGLIKEIVEYSKANPNPPN